MKYIAFLAIGLMTISATAFGASGSTSTGSTYTGTTSTGIVVSAPAKGAGGLVQSLNFTTGNIEIVPQCFPWVWLLEYYKGNIFDMYKNQAICQAKRKVDFGM